MEFHKVFPVRKPVIGVVHLPPLPGSPRYGGEGVSNIIERALSDARALVEGGVNGVIVENFMDNPFAPRVLEPETITVLTRIVCEIKREVGGPIGVNVLRNSGREALAVAFACSAEFIRVNALAEPVWSPEGLLEPASRAVESLRNRLPFRPLVLADVNVKHGVSMLPLNTAIHETIRRGLADAIIVTGHRTGEPPEPATVYYAKKISSKPVLVGSGINVANIRLFYKVCDGFIVGTYFKRDGITENPVDPVRVKRFIEVINSLRENESS